MRRAAAVALLLAPALGGCLGTARADRPPAPSDFDRERQALEATIAAARAAAADDTTLGRLLLLRSGLTGEVADEREAAAFLDAAIDRSEGDGGLLLLKARLEVRGHRLPDARRLLDALVGAAPPDEIEAVAADIDLQDGRYVRARARCARLLAHQRTWDVVARQAQIEALAGSPAIADWLYEEAQSDLSVKEMRSFAWLEIERGRLDRRAGRLDAAAVHYHRAARAYGGYWVVEQQQAELLAATGRHAEAAALYARLVSRSPRPEFRQAYGVELLALGQAAEAARQQEAARTDYLDSARRGESRYLHHLAGYYAEVVGDGAEAVRWARRDLQLRRGPEAYEELAGALARAGRPREAAEAAGVVLAFGLTDPWLIGRAEAIRSAVEKERGDLP